MVKKKDDPIVEAAEKSGVSFEALNEIEKEVYNAIMDYIDDMPISFLYKSLDELNKHFGGHDDVVVTEKVRQALIDTKELLDLYDDAIDVFYDLPETDEE